MSYGLTDTIIRCNPAAGETEKFRELKDELIYIVHHSPEGAVGVNLNQLYQQKITDLVESIPPFAHITPEQLIIPNLLKGGPVHANTPWVLASGRYAHQHSFSNDHMTLSFSDDGFSAEYDAGIVCGVGSYGWGEKQLERELAASLWHVFPADAHLLCNIPFSDPPRFAVDLFLALRFPEQIQIESRRPEPAY